jgi:uncharacterized protein (TIGR03437 family)
VRAAANLQPLDRLAPGALVLLDGLQLRTAGIPCDSSFPTPQSFPDLRVRIAGLDAPLFFANSQHVLLQVPYEVPPGERTIELVTPAKTVVLTRTVVESAPALFVAFNGSAFLTRFGDGALLDETTFLRTDDWWSLFVTGLPRDGVPVLTGQPNPARAPGEPYTSSALLSLDGAAARSTQALWTPGMTGVQQIVFNVDRPRGVYLATLTARGAASVPAAIPIRADDEPVLAGTIVPADAAKSPKLRTYRVSVTANGASQETTAPGSYLTYFPGKPAAGAPVGPLETTITHPDCYPYRQTHQPAAATDVTRRHVMIPRVTDPRETLRLNPEATKLDFYYTDNNKMYIVDPAAAFDLREFLIAGWRKGILETVDLTFTNPTRLQNNPVSMYNGRWWQQLPFKVWLNPDGAKTDPLQGGVIPNSAAVDAAAQAILGWNDKLPQTLVQIVDYDPTTRDGEQGAWVWWNINAGNGASLLIRPEDRSLQGMLFKTYRSDLEFESYRQSFMRAMAHEIGHLLGGLAHRQTRGVMRGVGLSSPTPDDIEYAAMAANLSFPGQFDHLHGRLARVGYDPGAKLGYDQPYFHDNPALIDRERWFSP